MLYKEKYETWLKSLHIDEVTKEELRILQDEKEIEDRFFKELEFGTGGLRGILGAGSNRMNVYTVGKATQGIAEYLKKEKEEASVSIAYDSRIKSKEFAETAACIFCANGIKVNLFESLRPTPMLSYTVRALKSTMGIVITASHNPKQYNGYKVYGEDGGQITDALAKRIFASIENIKEFGQIQRIALKEAEEKGLLQYIGEEIDKTYIDKVKALTLREDLVKQKAAELRIIYTPIHGSGNLPIRRVFKELGYKKVVVVKEQELPDGTFPTAPYPNPENPEVFTLALKLAETVKPDMIFGTDPDCDRIGVVVKDKEDNYKVLTGNQMGALLTQYILLSLKEKNNLPENGVLIKTIVTTELAEEIAKDYGIPMISVLTGFKYIGEKIKEFEKEKRKEFLFGFEESYGYLAGTFVRDKDAVIAAALIAEMTLWYKERKMSLYDGLMELYEQYGYYKEELLSFNLEGKTGMETMKKIMETFRNADGALLPSYQIKEKLDYSLGIEDLPKSNVLKFFLEDGSWFVVRPSGTEPKMKIYLSVSAKSMAEAERKLEDLKREIEILI